ncbi:MAG: hypothetical protein KDK78_04985 [Chlamydiia bacterium]|nr:hypothetical protein [Chlamydiia bacterium]
MSYVSGTAWTPALVPNLAGSDILIAGFGNTCQDDYSKMRYNSDCLGYFGTYSLMEQVAPKLLLCCEFGGREGDIRMEVVKKMRQEHAYGSKQQTVILPGDTGVCVDLRHLLLCCSVSRQLVDPSQVRVTKSDSAFGPLAYLSPSSVV